jgi:SGNH hydrolase-like domain, acetyltransferase AlgX
VSSVGVERTPYADVAGKTAHDLTSSWGMPTQVVDFRYQTDRHGFRNVADRAEADIYLLGDSMIVGALVPAKHTVSSELEKRSGKSVMQVALIGKGPQEVQQIFRDARLPVSGRTVIQAIFEGNDLLDSRRFRQLAASPGVAQTTRHSFVDMLTVSLQRWTQPVHGAAYLRTCQLADQTIAFGWVGNSFRGLEGEMKVVEESLKRFSAEVKAAGGRFAVVYIPTKLRVLGPMCRFPLGSEISDYASHLSPLREHMARWTRAEGIDFLDLTPALSTAARSASNPWMTGDTHWNEAGHQIAAEQIASWIVGGPPGAAASAPCKAGNSSPVSCAR